MEISKEDLLQRYSTMDDDSLMRIYIQGTLTPVANEAIQHELISRDIPLKKESMEKLLLSPVSLNFINKEPITKKKDWKDNYFTLLSVFAIILVLLLGMFFLVFSQGSQLDMVYPMACLMAVFIAPFGIIFGYLGLRYSKKHHMNSEVPVVAIWINIIFFLLGWHDNPFTQMGRAFGT